MAKAHCNICLETRLATPCNEGCLPALLTRLFTYIRFLIKHTGTLTLYNVILRIARNLLETRENIKIESHSFYHIICDRCSWGSSKKKSKMADFQNGCFSKSPILKIFLQKFQGFVLGLVGLIEVKV